MHVNNQLKHYFTKQTKQVLKLNLATFPQFAVVLVTINNSKHSPLFVLTYSNSQCKQREKCARGKAAPLILRGQQQHTDSHLGICVRAMYDDRHGPLEKRSR